MLSDFIHYRTVTDIFGLLGMVVSSIYLVVVYERGFFGFSKTTVVIHVQDTANDDFEKEDKD